MLPQLEGMSAGMMASLRDLRGRKAASLEVGQAKTATLRLLADEAARWVEVPHRQVEVLVARCFRTSSATWQAGGHTHRPPFE